MEIDNDFRIEKIDPGYRQLFQSAMPFLDTRSNVIHTFIVYQFTTALLAREPGEPAIALAACILHDVGWSTVPDEDQLKGFGPNMSDGSLRRKHEVEGARIARDILGDLPYAEDDIIRIIAIIDGHDTTREARSPEDAIVKDADKLWRYSKAGFRIDVERFDVPSARHMEYLAGNIDRWFLTEQGRAMAAIQISRRQAENGL